jgi:hypothetical protein
MNIKKTEEEIMKRIEFIEGRLNAYLLPLKMENRFINLEPSTPSFKAPLPNDYRMVKRIFFKSERLTGVIWNRLFLFSIFDCKLAL